MALGDSFAGTTPIRQKNITIIIIGVVFIIFLFGIIFSYFKLYLPDLPIENLSKKQAYEKIFNRHNEIVYLAKKGNYTWYIYQGNQKDGGNELIKRMNTLGLIFKEQMGSGYIFFKENSKDEFVVTSQMWTRKFVLFKAPNEVKF